MRIFEKELEIPFIRGHENLIEYFAHSLLNICGPDQIPIRFVVSRSSNGTYGCETGILEELPDSISLEKDAIFRLRKRKFEDTGSFNAVFLIPTGIGAELGGHAGDAAPAVKLIASLCDTLITHPNAVNASDLNEMPENSLYVEGSIICRLMMGSAGLSPVRSNRLLLVTDKHKDKSFVEMAVNSVNAARAAAGFNIPEIVTIDPGIRMKAKYTSSGRAAGRVDRLEFLQEVLSGRKNEYDAVGISSVISVPLDFHMDYFTSGGEMVNPWGGVEAILTHAVSLINNIPSAHSPMLESETIADLDIGIVDSRMAAEAVSYTFLHCILKGLHKSPKIICDEKSMASDSVISAENLSCLIIPDGCIGLPTLAALEQGIPVIAVKENKNMMKNDLRMLPWRHGKFYIAENYWEAAGLVSLIKEGIEPSSVRRPFTGTKKIDMIEIHSLENVNQINKTVLSNKRLQ